MDIKHCLLSPDVRDAASVFKFVCTLFTAVVRAIDSEVILACSAVSFVDRVPASLLRSDCKPFSAAVALVFSAVILSCRLISAAALAVVSAVILVVLAFVSAVIFVCNVLSATVSLDSSAS